MSGAYRQDLNWLVSDFTARVPDVAHAAVISADGVPMSLSDGIPTYFAEQLAAITSGLASLMQGAARIFELQIALSGSVPQICVLLGPAAAGGAYMPAFCDWVGMVNGNASMYLASPRVAEKVTGERTTLEDMGGGVIESLVLQPGNSR